MLFKREFHDGLRSGAITVTLRRWSKPQVRVGGRYRTPVGMLEVDRLDTVRVADVTRADLKRSGFADREALMSALRKPRPTDALYRVEFHYAGAKVDAPPAQDASLTREDVDTIAARLEKMDRSSRHGPWTRAALDSIRAHPRTPAAVLAKGLRRETRPFKADVRKLKQLGLTVSFDVGYEISPRGRAFLRRRKVSWGRSSSGKLRENLPVKDRPQLTSMRRRKQ